MTEADLRRIAFVTRRFQALQGLYLAILGAGLIAGTLLWSFMLEEQRDVVVHVMLFGQLIVMGASFQIDGYYRRTFGRVPARRFRGGMAAALPIVLLLLGMLADIFRSLDGTAGPSGAAISLIGFAIAVLVTDWRYRSYYLLGLVGGGVAAFFSIQPVPVGGWPVGGAGVPLVVALSVVGFTIMILGLLDHHLLSRALTPPESRENPAVPASRLLLSGVRLSASVLTLGAIAVYLGAAGWPSGDGVFLILFVVSLIPTALVCFATLRQVFCNIRELHVRHASERALLERLERLPDGKLAPLPELALSQQAPSEGLRPPPVDPLGHLVLPLSMAAGALIDIASRGTGAPSLLALAFAASQVRIATRDWPYRTHYLAGALTGVVASLHYMVVPVERALDWALVSLILISSAMILEGLLDRRLERAAEPSGRRADVNSF